MAKLNVDLARRAEIGARRRNKTRASILAAARLLFGRAGGRSTRVEDVCEAAGIARGTFYNYFASFEDLQAALFVDLSSQFDDAVHAAFEQLDGPAARTSAAIRYYLTHILEDREWGWGMVNTRMGIGQFQDVVTERVVETIQEGIDAGAFTISSAIAGRDLLLGSGLAAAHTLLAEKASSGHVREIAIGVLKSLGLGEADAQQLVRSPIPDLKVGRADNLATSCSH